MTAKRFIHLSKKYYGNKSLMGLGEIEKADAPTLTPVEQDTRETIVILSGDVDNTGSETTVEVSIPNESNVTVPSLPSIQARMSKKSAQELISLVDNEEYFKEQVKIHFENILEQYYGCYTTNEFYLVGMKTDPDSLSVRMFTKLHTKLVNPESRIKDNDDLFSEVISSVDFNSKVEIVYYELPNDATQALSSIRLNPAERTALSFEFADSDPIYSDINTSNPYSLVNELLSEAFAISFGLSLIDYETSQTANFSENDIEDVIKIANTTLSIMLSTNDGQSKIKSISDYVISKDTISYAFQPAINEDDILTKIKDFVINLPTGKKLEDVLFDIPIKDKSWLTPELQEESEDYTLKVSFLNVALNDSINDKVSHIVDFCDDVQEMIIELEAKSIQSCILDNLNLSSVDLSSRVAELIDTSNQLASLQIAYLDVFQAITQDTSDIVKNNAQVIIDSSKDESLSINSKVVEIFNLMTKNNIAFQTSDVIFTNQVPISRIKSELNSDKVVFGRDVDEIIKTELDNNIEDPIKVISKISQYYSDNTNRMISLIRECKEEATLVKSSLEESNIAIQDDIAVRPLGQNPTEPSDTQVAESSSSTEEDSMNSIQTLSIYQNTLSDFTSNFDESLISLMKALDSFESLTLDFQSNYEMLLGISSEKIALKAKHGMSTASKLLLAGSAVAITAFAMRNK